MKSPKQRFLELPLSNSFLQIIAQPDFLAALDYAMLQMVYEQPVQGMVKGDIDTLQATASAFRIEGARRFVDILTQLPIVVEPRKFAGYQDNLTEPH